jgi:hypothetical protein
MKTSEKRCCSAARKVDRDATNLRAQLKTKGSSLAKYRSIWSQRSSNLLILTKNARLRTTQSITAVGTLITRARLVQNGGVSVFNLKYQSAISASFRRSPYKQKNTRRNAENRIHSITTCSGSRKQAPWRCLRCLKLHTCWVHRQCDVPFG